MKWGWRRGEDGHSWRFDDRWSVAKDRENYCWYVVDGGKWRLEDHATAHEAMDAAERLMGAGNANP